MTLTYSTTVGLEDLVVSETKDEILAKILATLQGLSVPVSSWEVGDPTNAMMYFVSELAEVLQQQCANFAKSAFLDELAKDASLYEWLVLVAEQCYGYVATPASYASCLVRFSNARGGVYPIAPGEVAVKNSASGATYHVVGSGTLASGPGTTLDLVVQADEAGSASNASIGEIDTMVTSLPGVTCASISTATATDREAAASIVAGCRAKLGSLSPNGPADAYEYVALRPELTGTSVPKKCRVYAESATNDVAIIIAGTAGAVGSEVVTAVQDAIDEFATPLTVTAIAYSAATKAIALNATISAYRSWGVTDTEARQAIEASVSSMLANLPIGGDVSVGKVTQQMLEAAIIAAASTKRLQSEVLAAAVSAAAAAVGLDEDELEAIITAAVRSALGTATEPSKIISVSLTTPSADVTLASNDAAVLTTPITLTLNWIDDL